MSKRLQRFQGQGEEGFTLVELLVVIVILGILAAVVVFAVGGIKDKGQGSACEIDTRTVRTALEAYFAENDAYPATPADWPGTPASGGPRTAIDQQILVTKGFLSTKSTLHNASVYDNDPVDTKINPSVEVTVADTSNSTAVDKCGTSPGVAGTTGNQ